MPFYKRSDAKTFYARIQRDRLFDHAASLTYTTILSLVPMLAMAFAFFSAFGGIDQYRPQFNSFLAANLAPAFAEQVLGYVSSIEHAISAETLGIFGVVGFLITSVLMLDKIESAFNLIWGAVNPRPLMRRFTNYWTLLSIGPLMLGASLAFTAQAMSWLQSDSGDVARTLFVIVSILSPIVFSTAFFFTLFYILPNAGIHRRDAIYSAFLTALVFEVAKQGYAAYATFALKTSVYGSLSTLPVFFLWLYVAWMITLVGFEFCCYLEAGRSEHTYYDDEEFTLDTILLLDLLEMMSGDQLEGKGTDLKDLIKILKLNRRIILKHLEFLKEQRLVIESEPDERDGHIYHLAFGRETLDHRRLLETLERYRFRPVGRATQQVSCAQQLALLSWSLRSKEASEGSNNSEVVTTPLNQVERDPASLDH